jgi:hypothetical protein
VLAISRFAIAVIDSPLRLELTPIDKDSALIMECILLTNHNDTLLSASVCTFDRLSVDSCCLRMVCQLVDCMVCDSSFFF